MQSLIHMGKFLKRFIHFPVICLFLYEFVHCLPAGTHRGWSASHLLMLELQVDANHPIGMLATKSRSFMSSKYSEALSKLTNLLIFLRCSLTIYPWLAGSASCRKAGLELRDLPVTQVWDSRPAPPHPVLPTPNYQREGNCVTPLLLFLLFKDSLAM